MSCTFGQAVADAAVSYAFLSSLQLLEQAEFAYNSWMLGWVLVISVAKNQIKY